MRCAARQDLGQAAEGEDAAAAAASCAAGGEEGEEGSGGGGEGRRGRVAKKPRPTIATIQKGRFAFWQMVRGGGKKGGDGPAMRENPIVKGIFL